MTTNWELRPTTGRVTRPTFPYKSRFWDATNLQEAECIGLTADIGMEPEQLREIAHEITDYFRSRHLSNVRLHTTSKYSEHAYVSSSLSGYLDVLTSEVRSPWYADSVWLTFVLDGVNVFLEPESDGTEIAIFFWGEDATEAHSNMLRWWRTNH